MVVNFNLPIECSYDEFLNKNYWMNFDCVYKLSFNGGLYYIGKTGNLASRLYNHFTLKDLSDKSKPTMKHIEMIKSIECKRCIQVDVMSYNSDNEAVIVNNHFGANGCLNMKKEKISNNPLLIQK